MEKLVLLILFFSSIFSINQNDIPNFDKYYKPAEFKNMDMFSESAKYSFTRYKQSEHFFVFWEPGFGPDPNANSVPENLRVDVDDLIAKAEKFYETYVTKDNFSTIGKGLSYLDKYKLEIYLLYTSDWVATGSGYDNIIGALWVNPSTCKPVGSTIAHEIGHSFQYQVYCDQILRGETDPWAFKSGFRYGYEGSNGGCGLWEQTAQWQSYQLYPDEMFTSWNFVEWTNHHHRHFEHEMFRYASYWLHLYWEEKHGPEAIGTVWQESRYPDDAIQTYMRVYNGNDYGRQREELFDYAMKLATFDLDRIRGYSNKYVDRYYTTFFENNGYYQIAYAKCPGATGFNVIQLKVPGGDRTISVEFVGLEPGSPLAPQDPGEWRTVIDKVGGTVRNYNDVNIGNVGWRYGFVSMNNDGSRTYSETFYEPIGVVSFSVPENARRLFMVVQGSPNKYLQQPWDDNELTDAQFPYKIKSTNTSLKN